MKEIIQRKDLSMINKGRKLENEKLAQQLIKNHLHRNAKNQKLLLNDYKYKLSHSIMKSSKISKLGTVLGIQD